MTTPEPLTAAQARRLWLTIQKAHLDDIAAIEAEARVAALDEARAAQWDEDRLTEFLAPKMLDIVEHESKGTVVSLRDQARAGMWARSVARRLLHAGLVLPRAEAGTLDVERLVDAMNDAYEYDPEYVPVLPFHDDVETFWEPFAAKVLASLAGADRE